MEFHTFSWMKRHIVFVVTTKRLTIVLTDFLVSLFYCVVSPPSLVISPITLKGQNIPSKGRNTLIGTQFALTYRTISVGKQPKTATTRNFADSKYCHIFVKRKQKY